MPEALPFSTFDPTRVELSSPGTQRGLPFYTVDIVEADGGRACMWAGTDRAEAHRAAVDCADDGAGGMLPVADLVGRAEAETPAGTVH